jgi:signal transduction histidine kinase
VTALRKLLATTALRLFLIYSLVFTIAAVTVVGVIFWRTSDALTRQVLQVIAAEVRGLREQFRIGGLPLLVATLTERSRLPGSSLYLLVDENGRILAGNLEAVPSELTVERPSGTFRYTRRHGEDRRARSGVGVLIAVAGNALLIAGRDIEDQRAFTQSTQRIFLVGLGAMTLLALAGALWLGRGILRRVDAVTAASRRIMAGNLSERLPVQGSNDELDRLSTSLNEMLERIEQLLNGLREVSDNIAHDLKTPLTRLRNRAEAALAEPGGTAIYREGLVDTIEQADDVIKTFNALLAIARLEAGAATERLERADLAEIVADSVELYEPAIEDAGLTIAFGGEPGLIVRADRQLVGQAVANLIDNAIKYAAPGPIRRTGGGPDITITVAVRSGRAAIVVADRGPGIAPADRARALERFGRLDAARSRPGTGLGLSLVAAVARLHSGEVRLEDNEPGLRVVIDLPLAEHQAPAVPGRKGGTEHTYVPADSTS